MRRDPLARPGARALRAVSAGAHALPPADRAAQRRKGRRAAAAVSLGGEILPARRTCLTASGAGLRAEVILLRGADPQQRWERADFGGRTPRRNPLDEVALVFVSLLVRGYGRDLDQPVNLA